MIKNPVQLSVFVRILFPLFLTLILIHLIVGKTIHFFSETDHSKRPIPFTNIFRHLEFAKLEARPELSEALRTELRSAGLEATFESDRPHWSTTPKLFYWSQIDVTGANVQHPSPDIAMGSHGNLLFWAQTTPHGKLILFDQRRSPQPPGAIPFSVVFAFELVSILVLCYGILLWQLRPIKRLSVGVREVLLGNLSHQVPVRDSSELGLLSRAFNEMVVKLKRTIEAKEELILGVSHELRSPLATLELDLEMLRDSTRKQRMKRSTHQIRILVDELLEAHKVNLEEKHVQPIDLGDILREIIQPFGEQKRSIEMKGLKTALFVDGERPALAKLFRNLIENADKYSPADKKIQITLHDSLNEIAVSIRDYGAGIPETAKENIFEPFFRLEKSRNKKTGGYGLGLYLCKRIVASHNGALSVENLPTGGCQFKVVLPKTQKRRQVA